MFFSILSSLVSVISLDLITFCDMTTVTRISSVVVGEAVLIVVDGEAVVKMSSVVVEVVVALNAKQLSSLFIKP